ncbi:MAG: hypothetical protein FWC68_02475 [Oscillospiraceae bacterium]|nr:hypothetical protein [Oscillospiraceae bacterium]
MKIVEEYELTTRELVDQIFRDIDLDVEYMASMSRITKPNTPTTRAQPVAPAITKILEGKKPINIANPQKREAVLDIFRKMRDGRGLSEADAQTVIQKFRAGDEGHGEIE